ncbi:asparagine synthase (glutamine-hydrolyzing) [Pseudomonas sp. YY-1]|uniref:asparagine synthase (glutamine-hydrolyzing) n=1 Tax=Pseudomonas sp. YY-1 TaxID=2058659 RepID=UPI000CBD64BB|nr:asparagine synthase (glutamine-hydrolyzing) [Pseudomonas sp. YY-1]PKQ41250.1 asparagine synthase (glutamine-hydrolyzing) [Pseudomonas sp. YY-1]
MCAIAGIISQVPIRATDIQLMSDVQAHRGPDGQGFMLSQDVQADRPLPGLIDFSPASPYHIALAHRRLAIVDLSPQGHQPMVWQERYAITFNGEIYNHVELRQELESIGYSFASHSDTEVILAAYDAWGVSCLNKFNGMWAFVLVDTLLHRVFIARDRFAIKPLYYAHVNSTFIFASEIKALLEHSAITAIADPEFARNYLNNGPSETGVKTAWQGILRFPAASFVECSFADLCSENIQPQIYWDVRPNLSTEAFDDAKAQVLADTYYQLLEDAVRLRLRADVKVGSALSGGLDSSSIVYLINKILKEQGVADRQETFSSVYKSAGTQDCDESPFIDHLAHALDVRSNQIEPHVDAVPSEHEKLIYAMDYPPESTCMSGWHTFMLVAQTDVTVTLDGQGADEQLAGYLPYLAPWFAQMPLRQVAMELPKVMAIPGAYRFALRGLAVGLTRRICGKSFVMKLVRGLGYKMDPFIHLNEKLLQDLKASLRVLIHYSDRVSMAHSIESRMPFMDYRLVEFLASVPAAYKLHGGWTKYLARRAFSGKLPDEIVWRKDKMGWPIPESHWFEGSLKDWMAKRVKNPAFLQWLGVAASDVPLDRADASMTHKIRWLNLATWYLLFVEKSQKPPRLANKKTAARV